MEYRYKDDKLFFSIKENSIEYWHSYADIDDVLLKIADIQTFVRNEYDDVNNMWVYHMLKTLFNHILDNEGKDHLYFILDKERTKVKIGRAKDVDRRLKKLKSSTPFEIDLLKYIEYAGKYESRIHNDFIHNNLSFRSRFDGYTEWFHIDDKLSKFIHNIDYRKIKKKYEER